MTFGLVDLRGGRSAERLDAILARHAATDPGVEEAVPRIVSAVRTEGDEALYRFTREFDQVDPGAGAAGFRAAAGEIRELASAVSPALKSAVERAIFNVRLFHERQVQHSWTMNRQPGVTLGMRVRPLDSVGIYVPGGKAAYPSTVIMNAVPAQVAGVRRIVAVTPPRTFRGSPVVAYVLERLGIEEVYLVGGAQAVAALAYGTESIPRVDKVVGPGNSYVAAAKRQVFGQVAIDAIAGPSEVVVVADGSAEAAWVAADLLSQAEHDEAASAIAVTWEPDVAVAIVREVERQVARLGRSAIARESLARYGAVFLVEDEAAACELVDRLAPEHVELQVREPARLADRIRFAGALFLGNYTAEVVGDYLAGPNHVLPTHGTARFASPLGVYDFQVRTSMIAYDRGAFLRDAAAIEALAEAEGLGAHAEAVRIRAGRVGVADADAGAAADAESRGAVPAVDPLRLSRPLLGPEHSLPAARPEPVAFVKPSVRALAAYHL
ncbi:MAG: histidinol dehydrogenase, partial [Candidatus Sericytochromatia bacterium]|nr:histidinol dehydrogenase [Candidatus Tanganyikabacteria bacterium]